jgi:hypothetical protein
LKDHAIFYPIVAMVILVGIVARKMLRDRISEMKAKQLRPSQVAQSGQMAALIENSKAADNYRNLFEMPVLFYVLCICLFLTQSVSTGFLVGAWLYVALRYAHSYIQCTSNKVRHRFMAFIASVVVLIGMWLVWTIQQLSSL